MLIFWQIIENICNNLKVLLLCPGKSMLLHPIGGNDDLCDR